MSGRDLNGSGQIRPGPAQIWRPAWGLLGELVCRRPIKIGRRGVIVLAGLHARERERASARVSSGGAHRGSAGQSRLNAGVGISGGDEGDAVSSRTRARRGSQGGLGDDM
jgi:hypothetical protein